MKIDIKNLGAIKNSKIDLSKKLTIFCGPNNSGKTYAAYIIYALTKSDFKYFKSVENVFVQDLVKNQNTNFQINTDLVWNYRNEEIQKLNSSLSSIYGISEDIVNSLFKDFSISISETKKDFERKVIKMEFESELMINNLTIYITKKTGSSEVNLRLKDDEVSKSNFEFLDLFLTSKIFSIIAFFPFTSSYILPVERNSIYTFSKELSIQKQEFLERAQELGSKNISRDPFHWLLKKSTRYPLPIRDGLEVAEDLNNYSKIKTEFYSFAEDIEQELLNGKIIITKDGEVQFSSNKAKRKKIPIHLTASIVKTLSSLVFYLKHLATRNELIIIDEPELNLHPNNQVYLTRIFARLINKGFRLIISTHSDYIVRELNNLIMASSIKNYDSITREKPIYSSDDYTLNCKDVSAYLFNFKTPSSRNVTVSPIEVKKEGFDVETIDDTIDELNETSEELFYALREEYQNKIEISKNE